MPEPRQRFELVLRDADEPGAPPVIIRLRRFLKMALRAYGLRCTSAKQLDDQAQPINNVALTPSKEFPDVN